MLNRVKGMLDDGIRLMDVGALVLHPESGRQVVQFQQLVSSPGVPLQFLSLSLPGHLEEQWLEYLRGSRISS